MYYFITKNTFYNTSPLLWSTISQYCTRSVARNLKLVLETMPKENKHTSLLQKQRQKLKEKGQKYIPGTVTIKVLGSGAKGAPRSLYVFTDQSRYLFNCGEGTQRLAHEHKMKLSKLEHIFITHLSWENIGGLPGVALTIQDVGVPEITIHGPSGTDEIFSATRRFVVLRDLSVKMSNCAEGNHFEDNVMIVRYVPILSSTTNACTGATSTTEEAHPQKFCSPSRMSETEESDDDVDYYAHERKMKRTQSGSRERKRQRTSSRSPGRQPLLKGPAVSMCYVCQLRARPGTLCLERCVEKGVPPGPLLGRLKSGQDVVLANGEIVRSADVCLPDDPGPIFIVVECPTVDFVDSLVNNPTFSQYQSTAEKDDDAAHLVVHFTPNAVMKDPRYQSWMEKFIPSTNHLVLNEENNCMGSVAVHRIQHKLHMLHPKIFPLLQDFGIPVVVTDPDTKQGPFSESSMPTLSCEEKVIKNGVNRLQSETEEKVNNSISVNGNEKTQVDAFANVCLVRGKTFCSVHLRPRRTLDRQGELTLNPRLFVNETKDVEGFPEALTELQQCLKGIKPVYDSGKSYPHVVFLGTGSCIPNKTRNTSGILLNISDSDSLLLDCGEGTYGQLVRFYGTNNIDEMLCKLRAVYVSHLHADHHIGLIGVLKGRRRALAKRGVCHTSVHQPIFLLAPKQIMSWLSLYHRRFEPILQDLELIPNGDLDLGDHKLNHSTHAHLLEVLGMVDVSTVLVKHCPNAFGVALQHRDNWKITYSGDTMPCPQLIELGSDSDLLIHEATMEDELEREAQAKLHSTTSQAIEMGQRMKAKFTLLTHFSQRYAKLPRFNDNFTSNVGIAFDNMQVGLGDLPLLPLLYPSLKLMFAEHYEELEQKAARRLMKQERERENKAP